MYALHRSKQMCFQGRDWSGICWIEKDGDQWIGIEIKKWYYKKKILRILKSLDSRWSLDYDDDGDDEDGDDDDDDDDGDDASFSGSYQVSGWAVNGRELAATGTNRSFLHDGDHHDRD